jgi:hypothetical protein
MNVTTTSTSSNGDGYRPHQIGGGFFEHTGFQWAFLVMKIWAIVRLDTMLLVPVAFLNKGNVLVSQHKGIERLDDYKSIINLKKNEQALLLD